MTKVKILHYSTHNEDCGIGKYQEQFLSAMKEVSVKDVDNEFFEYSPNQTKVMSYNQFTAVLDELKEQLRGFDLLHIQHELSFYKHDELGRIVNAAHELGKRVIITVHTAPDAQYKVPFREGYGPRSIVKFIREKRAAKEFNEVHLEPLRRADLVLVHNATTSDNLVKHGVDRASIQQITLPVPSLSFDEKSSEIKDALRYTQNDIIIASVGFVSETKGVKQAVKALKYLPENYKLAIIGGVHPSGGGEAYLDEVCDTIIDLELKDRVYITGFIEEDARLNSLIRECDVCIYPYDRKYYSFVSSAALNNALANHKPAIVYPTPPFIEMNAKGTVAITKSANYYELARYIVDADYKLLAGRSKEYATEFGYLDEAKKLVMIYQTQATLL
ncbi:glycosyltransferase [Candidatus Saccharibacteria bacterium]|nr:glycosyltransferase [Candidatus Saccharibacteria bacterium]MBH1973243.1 glycosyltransferase [Candidatus Saccharibacteria bacterium]MBH1990516.1 glycosyltransferase [Candidatus Saccharibacteria bacterium]